MDGGDPRLLVYRHQGLGPVVRLDVYLSAVCVLKSRSMAKEACTRGKVSLNGATAKASHGVSSGDRIRVDLGTRILEVEVLDVPPGPVSKKRAPDFCRVLEDVRQR